MHRGGRTSRSEHLPIWPVLRKFEDATPLDSSFQAHEVAGGLELFDLDAQVSIASPERHMLIEVKDSLSIVGVSECAVGECAGNNVLSFSPPLPPAAFAHRSRVMIDQQDDPTPKKLLQALFIIGLVACCCCSLGG